MKRLLATVNNVSLTDYNRVIGENIIFPMFLLKHCENYIFTNGKISSYSNSNRCNETLVKIFEVCKIYLKIYKKIY